MVRLATVQWLDANCQYRGNATPHRENAQLGIYAGPASLGVSRRNHGGDGRRPGASTQPASKVWKMSKPVLPKLARRLRTSLPTPGPRCGSLAGAAGVEDQHRNAYPAFRARDRRARRSTMISARVTSSAVGSPTSATSSSRGRADRLARRQGTQDAVVIGLGSMTGAGLFAALAPAASARPRNRAERAVASAAELLRATSRYLMTTRSPLQRATGRGHSRPPLLRRRAPRRAFPGWGVGGSRRWRAPTGRRVGRRGSPGRHGR